MKSLREHTANKIFYVIGLVMLFPLVLLILLQNTGVLHLTESLYLSMFFSPPFLSTKNRPFGLLSKIYSHYSCITSYPGGTNL